jgi:RHS repeat-associated protein
LVPIAREFQVWNPTRCNPTASPCAGETTWGITTFQYDALNREKLMIPPDGSQSSNNIRTTYTGNSVTVTDEAGKTRTTTTDALGRLVQVSEGSLGYVTLNFYDALGNLTCIEQHGGVTGTGCASSSSNDATSPWRVRRFTYDSLSHLISAKNPETGTITYGYNLDGVLTSKTDARGVTVYYTPDALHRVQQKSYSNSEPTVTYSYDAFAAGSNYGVGMRTGMSDASGSTSWTYDKMGRVWSEQQTVGSLTKSVQNTYNLYGSVATITYPSGSVLSVVPGADGEPLSATDTTNNISYAKSLIYAPTAQMTSAIFGYSSNYAGIQEINSYNSRGQPIRLQACGLPTCTDGASSQTPYLLDLGYNYGLGVNDNGNVLGITNNKDTSRSQSFSYDALNRLSQATSGTAWGIAFSIDAWGNLYQTNAVSGTSTNPMSVSQVMNVKNQFTVSGYGYDAAGNVVTDGGGINACPGALAYNWNAEEQLSCAAGATYNYDGDGVRVKKSGGSAAIMLYWGAGTLAESDMNGILTAEYIYLNGRRIARRDISNSAVHYYFSDTLGSSNSVASATGALENESDFYPFGGERAVVQNLANQQYKFEGKERDSETSSLSQPQGLDNFGARFDSSSTGRFLSPDWANSPQPVPYAKLDNPQTLNLYAFALNNPESAPDIDGHRIGLPTCDMFCLQNAATYRAQMIADGQFTIDLGYGFSIRGSFVTFDSTSCSYCVAAMGVTIDAYSTCTGCEWIQVVYRTGADAKTGLDNDPQSKTPFYPYLSQKGRNGGFWDQPKNYKHGDWRKGAGEFRAVSVLGTPDFANRIFHPIAAISWGYTVSADGKLTVVPPKAAPDEIGRAMRLMRQDLKLQNLPLWSTD